MLFTRVQFCSLKTYYLKKKTQGIPIAVCPVKLCLLYDLLVLIPIITQECVDLISGIQQVADGLIVIERVDDV